MEQVGKSLQDLMNQATQKIKAPDDKAIIEHLTSDEGVEDFHKQQEIKYTQQYFNRKYAQMFKRDSLFSDPDLKNATFDNFKVTNDEQKNNLHLAKQFAFDYCKGGKFNTLIVGNAGRGKTHLAVSMLKAINQYQKHQNKFFSCLFMDVNRMVERMIDYEFHGGSDKYSRYHMENLCNEADLLVLDDLGTESSMKKDDTEANNMTQKLLYNILNGRNNTIITTNLSSRQIYNVYNPKINSRIKRNIGNHIIKFTDKTKDMRQEGMNW